MLLKFFFQDEKNLNLTVVTRQKTWLLLSLGQQRKKDVTLTHIGLIFEGEVAISSNAMEVGCSLTGEGAGHMVAVLGCSKPLETLLHDSRVLPVIIGMHLDV